MINILEKNEFEKIKDDYITLGNWAGLTEEKPPKRVIREAVKMITKVLKQGEYFKSFKKREVIVKTYPPEMRIPQDSHNDYPCTVGVKIKCKYRGYDGYVKSKIVKLLPLVEGQSRAEIRWIK